MLTTMPMTHPSTTTPPEPAAVVEHCCPSCGHSLPAASDLHTTALLQAQRQIEDLQAQVRLLNQKAAAAVDRWADYEDELSRLRAASTSTDATVPSSNTNTTSTPTRHGPMNRPHTPDPSIGTNSPRSSFLGAGAASRISQLLSPRKTAAIATAQQRGSLTSMSSSALPLDGDHGKSTAEVRELLAALTRERGLRTAAEEKLATSDRELQDLTASLFEQANNMVATERRARAGLEDKVRELEERDAEKKARVERLEGAVQRIESARAVLRRSDTAQKIMEEEDEEEGDMSESWDEVETGTGTEPETDTGGANDEVHRSVDKNDRDITNCRQDGDKLDEPGARTKEDG
ncbi:hypothetical protein F4777DRAFT_96376 [Nemania sp. FL0916]|nr:hypothetical protein F4777DRAFT_96376 [Nemania sp. FL0916]